MNDPHLNIFHAYRGPSESDEASARQLEDNLTRALVVALTHLRDSRAGALLLAALGVPGQYNHEPYQCSLQVTEVDTLGVSLGRRLLVVVHGGPVLSQVVGLDNKTRSRLDAVIEMPHYVLGVESKLGSEVEQGQIERHLELLGIPGAGMYDTTWTRLARVAQETLRHYRLQPVAQFVLQQFEEYLRMNGFGGLTDEHLSYFARRQEHRDDLVKQGIRRAIEELMAELARLWDTNWQPHIGNITSNTSSTWAKLTPAKPGQAPHLSVAINPAGLDIFGNIETTEPYRRFQGAWHNDPEPFLRIIRQLGDSQPHAMEGELPWRLEVVRRVPTGRPRTFDYWTAVDMATVSLRDWPDDRLRWFVETATAKPAGEAAPEIKLIRTYPASFIINDDRLADRLAADAARLEPFFNWIGEPPRSKSSGLAAGE